MSEELPPNQDWFEYEIARTVVLPRLKLLVQADAPRSKSALYQMWVDKHGPISRARFDLWLDLLEIRFVRTVTIEGLYQPVVRPMSDLDGDLDDRFDNESDEDAVR